MFVFTTQKMDSCCEQQGDTCQYEEQYLYSNTLRLVLVTFPASYLSLCSKPIGLHSKHPMTTTFDHTGYWHATHKQEYCLVAALGSISQAGGGNTFYHKKGNALVQRQAMHTTVSWLYQGYSSEILLSLTLLQMACSWKEYKSDFGRFGRLNKSDFWEVWMVKTFGDPRVTEHRSHD